MRLAKNISNHLSVDLPAGPPEFPEDPDPDPQDPKPAAVGLILKQKKPCSHP